MKKETIIAVIFGIVMGGFLGFFLINKNKETQLIKNKVIAPSNVAGRLPSTSDTAMAQNLEISSPQDGVVVGNNSIKVSGKAEANSLIIIQTPVNDISFKNDKVDFSLDLPLALGENVIKIVVYPSSKNQNLQDKYLRVYYLDSQL